jgi:hypothetical protein
VGGGRPVACACACLYVRTYRRWRRLEVGDDGRRARGPVGALAGWACLGLVYPGGEGEEVGAGEAWPAWLAGPDRPVGSARLGRPPLIFFFFFFLYPLLLFKNAFEAPNKIRKI